MENNVYHNNNLDNILFSVMFVELCKPSCKLSANCIFYQIQTRIKKYPQMSWFPNSHSLESLRDYPVVSGGGTDRQINICREHPAVFIKLNDKKTFTSFVPCIMIQLCNVNQQNALFKLMF